MTPLRLRSILTVDLNGNNGKNRLKSFAIIIVLLSALFICSCDGLMTTGDFKSFDYKLRGTWISNDAGLRSGLTHKSINYWRFLLEEGKKYYNVKWTYRLVGCENYPVTLSVRVNRSSDRNYVGILGMVHLGKPRLSPKKRWVL